MASKVRSTAVTGGCKVKQSNASALDRFLTEDRKPLGSPVSTGAWFGDLDKCRAYARATGRPMIAVWSNRGCSHCDRLENAFMSATFRKWMKSTGFVFCFTCSDDPKGKRGTGPYYTFCRGPERLKEYPFVRFYWYSDDRKVVDYSETGEVIDKGQGPYKKTYDKAGKIVIDYILNTAGFGKYVEKPAKYKLVVGYNPELTVSEIEEKKRAVIENGGYCPCQERSADSKCRCVAFRGQRKPGTCICGLYCKFYQ